MIRVVADTNILISAVMFGGLPKTFLDHAFLSMTFCLFSSPVLLDELDEKLRTKFRVGPGEASLIRFKIESHSSIIRPSLTVNAIDDDPDDNRVLECAVAADANYIVSGDRHLLTVGRYRKTDIINVRSFMTSMKLI